MFSRRQIKWFFSIIFSSRRNLKIPSERTLESFDMIGLTATFGNCTTSLAQQDSSIGFPEVGVANSALTTHRWSESPKWASILATAMSLRHGFAYRQYASQLSLGYNGWAPTIFTVCWLCCQRTIKLHRTPMLAVLFWNLVFAWRGSWMYFSFTYCCSHGSETFATLEMPAIDTRSRIGHQ